MLCCATAVHSTQSRLGWQQKWSETLNYRPGSRSTRASKGKRGLQAAEEFQPPGVLNKQELVTPHSTRFLSPLFPVPESSPQHRLPELTRLAMQSDTGELKTHYRLSPKHFPGTFTCSHTQNHNCQDSSHLRTRYLDFLKKKNFPLCYSSTLFSLINMLQVKLSSFLQTRTHPQIWLTDTHTSSFSVPSPPRKTDSIKPIHQAKHTKDTTTTKKTSQKDPLLFPSYLWQSRHNVVMQAGQFSTASLFGTAEGFVCCGVTLRWLRYLMIQERRKERQKETLKLLLSGTSQLSKLFYIKYTNLYLAPSVHLFQSLIAHK